jgi:hypothetical protein
VQSRYEEACDYFNKAYTLARARNDTRLISSSRVQFGIAQAHKMYTNFAVQLEMGAPEILNVLAFVCELIFKFLYNQKIYFISGAASRHCIKTQLEWKSSRVDKFNAKIPDIKGKVIIL